MRSPPASLAGGRLLGEARGMMAAINLHRNPFRSREVAAELLMTIAVHPTFGIDHCMRSWLETGDELRPLAIAAGPLCVGWNPTLSLALGKRTFPLSNRSSVSFPGRFSSPELKRIHINPFA